MNRAAALLVASLLFLTACSSASDDAPPERRGGYGGGERVRSGGASMMGEAGSDTLPPPDWWRDPRIATAVNLTPDQYKSLDALSADANDVDALRRASMDAARDFRLILDSDKPTREDILAAGQRMRTSRDALLDRNVQLLAAQRALLSKEQWASLQTAMRPTRDDFRGSRGNGDYGRRGRGGRGGMGRPGGWGW
jgi:Spy/CpxP family protein refolding chaperone